MSENGMKYITCGVMDEDFIRATNKCIMNPPRNRVIAIASATIIAVCALLLLAMGFAYNAWDILLDVLGRYVWIYVALVAFHVFIKLIARWSVNQSIKRIAEENPGCRVEYEIGFAEDGVHLHHLTNGGKVVFAYDSLKKLIHVGNEWVLQTKTRAFFPVFSSQLSETDRLSVIDLLKAKNPKIKINLKRKK